MYFMYYIPASTFFGSFASAGYMGIQYMHAFLY